VLAIRRGTRQYGRLLNEFSDEELRGLVDRLIDEA
jgi:hypothetical protein